MQRTTTIVRSVLVCLILAGLMVWPTTVAAAGSPYYVGTLADDDGTHTANCGSSTNTDCSLRSAIAAASSGSDWIMFRSGLTGTITLTHGTLHLTKSVLISGPGTDKLTVDGNHASRVFQLGSPVWASSYPSFSITGLTVSGGKDSFGAGMYIASVDSAILWKMAFSHNEAFNNGGGLYIDSIADDTDAASTPIVINDSTFNGNIVTRTVPGPLPIGGAGIFIEEGDGLTLWNINIVSRNVTITNSTITDNHAYSYYADGGGILTADSLSLVNSTIARNSSGGSATAIRTSGDPVNLTNTIVSGHILGRYQGDNNLITSGEITGNNNLIGVDPILGEPGYYGGPTQTIPLLPGSPAIGAGVNNSVTPMRDQRGIERTGHVDIGAFQSRGFTLTKVSGDHQATTIGANFPEPFIVAVESPYGEPTVGGMVFFSGPGVQGSPVGGRLAANNQTSETLTASAFQGHHTVLAGFPGVTPVEFSLENTDTFLPVTVATVTQVDGTPYNIGVGALPGVKIILAATDVGSGVANTQYTINGGSPQIYVAPIIISEPGSQTVTYWSTDTFGNVEVSQSVTIIIDPSFVPPDTTILTHPAAVVPLGPMEFTFSGSGSNPIVGFECRVLFNEFSDCSNPATFTDLKSGFYTFEVRAIDSGGNIDTTPARYRWTADGTLPETWFRTTPPTVSSSSSVSFTFDGGDTGYGFLAGFECALDDAPFSSCTSPHEISGLTTGAHTFQVRAVDTAGNVDASPVSYAFDVELIPNDAPTALALSYSSVPENFEVGTTVGSFTTTDPDATDTHGYSLVSGDGAIDNAAFTINGNTLQTAAVFDFESQSSYSIRVRSTDRGGLTIEQPFTISVIDGNEAPTALALAPSSVAENSPIGATVGTFTTTDPDAGSTHTYTLVGGAGDTDNAAFTITGDSLLTATALDADAQNSYSIRVRTDDGYAGTFEQVFTITVTAVEATAATITLDPSTLSQTYTGSPQVVTATTTPAGLSYSITYDGITTPPTDAGNYIVVATVTEPGYAGSGTGTLTIGKAEQTISFTSTAPANPVYGDTYTPAASGGGSSNPVSFAAGGACTYDANSGLVTMIATGECTVTVDQTGDANHTTAEQQVQSFTVTKAALDVTANDATMTYGGAVPRFEATVTGLVNGDTFATLDGTCSAEVAGSPVTAATPTGTYPAAITCSGVNATNYDVTYTPGTLTIIEAPRITSAAAATFTVGVAGSYTITASGVPASTFSSVGPLPAGLNLGNDGLLSGTPEAGTEGDHTFEIIASNGVTPDAHQTFTLTIVVPMIVAPENLTVPNDAGFAGATVSYPAPETVGQVGEVTCSPVSEAFFDLGTTTVTCVSSLTPATASFTITVVDTAPPTIPAPANIVMPAGGPAGAVINYAAPVVTDNAPGVAVACTPPSGALFPIGDTTVTCTATDTSGNTASATFTVTVASGTVLLQQLKTMIEDLPISGNASSAENIRRNLLNMVAVAELVQVTNIPLPTCLVLTRIDTDIQSQVSKRRIASADAAAIYAMTNTIRTAIGCSTR